MYSIVLMMALSTGGEAPDCHRHSCDGGGMGSACHGGGGLFRRHHCHGAAACNGGVACSGGVACYGGAPGGCYGGAVMPYPPTGPRPEPIKMPGDKKPEEKKPEDLKKPIGSFGAPAKLIVSMPADARFTIDSYTSPAKSDTHIVVSSPLSKEETKTYVLKAEVVRDGKLQTMEESVTVRAGQEVKVTLSLPTVVAAR
jgi:uncharacterized protein (TIGR03000 family)